ncbi:hypothetical protein GS931_21565 [Rhodococcus hoagii]|nr:hypothetical protein [Prescottella equi]
MRAILCGPCNVGFLGHLRDDIDALRRAIEVVRDHPRRPSSTPSTPRTTMTRTCDHCGRTMGDFAGGSGGLTRDGEHYTCATRMNLAAPTATGSSLDERNPSDEEGPPMSMYPEDHTDEDDDGTMPETSKNWRTL